MRLASASGGSGARRAIQDLYQDVRLCVNRGEWVKGELKVKLAHEEAGAQISLDFIPSDEAQEACELSLSHWPGSHSDVLAVHQCASNEGEHFLELTVPSEDDTMDVRFNFGNRAAVVAKLCAALTLPGVMTPAGLAVSSSGSSSSSSSSSSASKTPPAEEEEEDDDDEDDDERKTKVLGKGPAKPQFWSPPARPPRARRVPTRSFRVLC